MTPGARRQLKDIQVRAEHLMNGNPSIEEVEEFDRYNEELKRYLLMNLTEPELIERVRAIPEILEESEGQVITRGVFMTAVGFFSPALVAYFHQRTRIENAKDSIRDARGAYATIEFFVKNMD